ncbi:MAG: hypothetical protein R3321_10925, partial [Nitrososphaeraceae archaeon]|nr:hypothetical protein [Nitrososphaeraceae archaeon]
MTNKYLENYNEITESNGLKDPVTVNEIEKNKYLKNYENLRKQELQERLKKGDAISFADTSWGQTILNSFNNLPSDVVPVMKEELVSLYEAIKHPYLTGKNLVNMGMGMLKTGVQAKLRADPKYSKFVKSKEQMSAQDEQLKIWMQVEDELYNNFGTEENLKKYIAENPTRAIIHIGSILFPIAKASKATGAVKIGRTLEKMAKYTDPLTAGIKIATLPYG